MSELNLAALKTAYLEQCRRWRPLLRDYRLRSVYLAGPLNRSHLLVVTNLLEALQLGGHEEVTGELRVHSANCALISLLRAGGVNRFSLHSKHWTGTLGTQSTEVVGFVERAFEANATNLSLDLPIGAPGQNPVNWNLTLDALLKWPLAHLALVEFSASSRRAKQEPLPSDRQWLAMFNRCDAVSPAWERYEIAAICRPGRESIHNSGYWRGRACLGLGPGACSFWNKERFRQRGGPARYIQNAAGQRHSMGLGTPLGPSSAGELLSLHLRLTRGVQLAAFSARWRAEHLNYIALTPWLQRRWLMRVGQRVELTLEGRRYYDALAGELCQLTSPSR